MSVSTDRTACSHVFPWMSVVPATHCPLCGADLRTPPQTVEVPCAACGAVGAHFCPGRRMPAPQQWEYRRSAPYAPNSTPPGRFPPGRTINYCAR